jgi:uncharacterized protein YggL (DUF469 family)
LTCECKKIQKNDLYELEFSSAQPVGKIIQPEITIKKFKNKIQNKVKENTKPSVGKNQSVILNELKESAFMLNRNLKHEVSSTTVPNCIEICGIGYTLFLNIQVDGLVREAYFHCKGELWYKNLLDLYCELSLDTPFQEIADHNVLKIINELISKNNLKLAGGVLLPENCGSFFTELIIACRKVYNDWIKNNQSLNNINLYIQPPSDTWQKTENEVLLQRIKNCIIEYYKELNLSYNELISGIKLEKNKSKYLIRVIIEYSNLAKVDKPRDLLRMENYIRLHLEKTLEVITQRISDTSPLRRLTK